MLPISSPESAFISSFAFQKMTIFLFDLFLQLITDYRYNVYLNRSWNDAYSNCDCLLQRKPAGVFK